MSYLIAKVSKIESCDSLHIVNFECNSQTLTMMSLDINESLKVGTKVKLTAKASHVAIAKEFSGDISYSNRLLTIIEKIENGELLTSIKLSFFDTTLESIITLNSSKRMNLKVGDKVTAFIKASELSISEIIDD
ncbi:MAG: TOBE domain-containing protein [Campylobacterota bacterium]|nr:TOBE domain-containing protein [Campylobacterota bacterium]